MLFENDVILFFFLRVLYVNILGLFEMLNILFEVII